MRRIESMPRDVGWLLVAAGVFGEIVPGVIGTPFWVMGGLVLWPSMGKRAGKWLESRAPQLFRGGMRQVGRFLDDLDRRYPPGGSKAIARKKMARHPGIKAGMTGHGR